ncbi:MAG: ABC transporter permease, partial [Gemmatimonadaceae bacterium]
MFSNGIRDGVRRLFKLPSRTRSHVEADVNQELETFLAERVDYLVARGMSPSDARFEALKRLGPSLADASALLQNSAITRERRMRIRDMFDDFKQDLRYAGRTLKRDVRFSVFAIIIIALGIGASVTVFSVANTLLVRPLPFSDADRLVWIQNGNSDGLSGQTTQVNHMLDLRAQSKSYADIEAYMAFYGIGDANLTDKGNSVRLSNVQVTQKFFPLLGVQPFLGRQFTQEESAQNGPLVAMMSYSLWERQFASDKSIIGKSITVNSQSVMVVGVLPETFDFGQVFAPGTRIDFFSPFPLSEQTNKWGNTMAMLGRLKSGATLAGAKAELALLGPQIAKAHPERNGFEPSVVLLQEHVTGGVKGALIALSFAVGVVMLIVCANLSNLLLARSTTRNKEMAVRAALGAGRRRLVRQMLTESMVLALCGAAIGIVVAIVGTRAIAHMDAVSLPLLASVRVDVSALTFAVLLSLGSGIAFGLAPALQIPESAMHDALKVSGRSTTDGKRGAWIRRSLVVSEIAMACMLLVGSGLLIRSFLKVLEVDLGFKPEMVASIRVDADRKTMASQELFDAYVNEVLRIARALPGVKSAGLSDGLPLGSNRTWGVSAKGVTYKREEYPQAYVRIASDGFMASLQTNLIEGRDFTAQDVPKSEKVVVINRSLARLLWPGESAVGKFANIDTVRRVVGVVADVRHLALEKDAGN